MPHEVGTPSIASRGPRRPTGKARVHTTRHIGATHLQGRRPHRRWSFDVDTVTVRGVPRVRPMVGEAAYQVAGAGSRWSRRGAGLLGRVRRRLHPESEQTTAIAFRVRRVSAMSRLSRARTRLWLAWVHAWRTKWADFDWYVSAEAGRRKVSIVGIADRHGTIGGGPSHLGLIGGVFTRPEYRRRGLATEVVRRSVQLLSEQLGCEFALLICSNSMIPFYERLGWKVAPNKMTFERFGERGVVQGKVMVYECTARRLPAGIIDVRGLPA